MRYNGYVAKIMEADRLVGDCIHALPPGTSLPVYDVDQFSKHPDSWMTGPGNYVVPVKPNKGLWFDWTANDIHNTAVLPSVKGCNPITGLPTTDLKLVKYTKCPTHDIEFTNGSYCEKCGYRWPTQNYVTAPNKLWWDGFRADDGSVRQFFFTEDLMRDMPSQLIGEKNTVPAFGFAFYSPKTRRVNPIEKSWLSMSKSLNMPSGALYSDNYIANASSICYAAPVVDLTTDSLFLDKEMSIGAPQALADQMGLSSLSRGIKVNKEVSIGAGAKINQALTPDVHALSTWQDEPDAVMRIYFIFEADFEKWKLASGGLKEFDTNSEGMLIGKIVG